MTNKNENTSRSSSGSGEREAIHAIRDVWLSARTNDDTPPGCYLVDSEPMLHAHGVMLRALSSAPPAPSGERVRALEEALREAVTLLSGPLTVLHRVHTPSFWICTCEAEADSDYPTGKPCSCPRPEMKIGCVENCPACAAKRARDAFVERARALSPQGDGGTER